MIWAGKFRVPCFLHVHRGALGGGRTRIVRSERTWDNIPEEEPDKWDLKMLKDIESDPECHVFVSSDDAKKLLGLTARELQQE